MGRRPWKARRNFWTLSVALAVLTALLALGITVFINAFSSHKLTGYDPKDMKRGEHLEKKQQR